MDFMERITDLRAQKSQLLAQAQPLADEGKYDEVDKISAQMESPRPAPPCFRARDLSTI